MHLLCIFNTCASSLYLSVRQHRTILSVAVSPGWVKSEMTSAYTGDEVMRSPEEGGAAAAWLAITYSSVVTGAFYLPDKTRVAFMEDEPMLAAPTVPDAGRSCDGKDVPSVIIGVGRIGSLLKELGCNGDFLVRRGDKFPNAALTLEGPIYIATRNADLDAAIEIVPPSRRSDLVFMQNGMIMPYLTEKAPPYPSPTPPLPHPYPIPTPPLPHPYPPLPLPHPYPPRASVTSRRSPSSTSR